MYTQGNNGLTTACFKYFSNTNIRATSESLKIEFNSMKTITTITLNMKEISKDQGRQYNRGVEMIRKLLPASCLN